MKKNHKITSYFILFSLLLIGIVYAILHYPHNNKFQLFGTFLMIEKKFLLC